MRGVGSHSGLSIFVDVFGEEALRHVGTAGLSDEMTQLNRHEGRLGLAAPGQEDAAAQQADRGDHVGDVGAGLGDRDVFAGVIHAPMLPISPQAQEGALYNSRVARQHRTTKTWTDNQRWQLAAETGFACAYCQVLFGSAARRPGHELVIVRMEVDHIRPFAWTGHEVDTENCVAACQICNGLKQDAIFDSIVNARRHLDRLWVRAGYAIDFIPTRSHFEDPEGWAKEYARHMRTLGVRQDAE
mgnify:CR=1 FL=1